MSETHAKSVRVEVSAHGGTSYPVTPVLDYDRMSQLPARAGLIQYVQVCIEDVATKINRAYCLNLGA